MQSGIVGHGRAGGSTARRLAPGDATADGGQAAQARDARP
jgi:hypothetical protein